MGRIVTPDERADERDDQQEEDHDEEHDEEHEEERERSGRKRNSVAALAKNSQRAVRGTG